MNLLMGSSNLKYKRISKEIKRHEVGTIRLIPLEQGPEHAALVNPVEPPYTPAGQGNWLLALVAAGQ